MLTDTPDAAAMGPSRQSSLVLFSGTEAFAFTLKLQESKSTT